jgi:hypothetical protein
MWTFIRFARTLSQSISAMSLLRWAQLWFGKFAGFHRCETWSTCTLRMPTRQDRCDPTPYRWSYGGGMGREGLSHRVPYRGEAVVEFNHDKQYMAGVTEKGLNKLRRICFVFLATIPPSTWWVMRRIWFVLTVDCEYLAHKRNQI